MLASDAPYFTKLASGRKSFSYSTTVGNPVRSKYENVPRFRFFCVSLKSLPVVTHSLASADNRLPKMGERDAHFEVGYEGLAYEFAMQPVRFAFDDSDFARERSDGLGLRRRRANGETSNCRREVVGYPSHVLEECLRSCDLN